MRFAWDAEKNRRNQIKHKLSFETAALVFEDPHALSQPERIFEDEERWQTIGLVQGTLIFVAHTITEEEEDELVRIISARKATRRERISYEEAE